MSEDSVNTQKETETVKKKRFPLWSKIVAGVVVFIVVIVVIAVMATSSIAKISNEFIKDIQTKNAAGAYSLLSRDAQAVTDRDRFTQLVDQIGPVLNTTPKMISREASGQTGSAATGKVVYEIKGTDGITYKVTVNMTKQDDEWKVLNFESARK